MRCSGWFLGCCVFGVFAWYGVLGGC